MGNRLPYRRVSGRCGVCGYDLRSDGRDPDYCPQCGRCQKKEAIAQRDRQLMRQLEQIREELDRNHLDRIG